jgi:hypothetical protein
LTREIEGGLTAVQLASSATPIPAAANLSSPLVRARHAFLLSLAAPVGRKRPQAAFRQSPYSGAKRRLFVFAPLTRRPERLADDAALIRPTLAVPECTGKAQRRGRLMPARRSDSKLWPSFVNRLSRIKNGRSLRPSELESERRIRSCG